MRPGLHCFPQSPTWVMAECCQKRKDGTRAAPPSGGSSTDHSTTRPIDGGSVMAVTAATYPRAAGEATAGSFNHSRAIFGVVVALIGAAVVLFLYVRGQPQTVEVLKAAHDLAPGAVLRSDDLVAETEPLSEGLAALVVPAGERDTVIGRPLGDGLKRGLPLARAQLLDQAQRIPDNLRVVALPVTPETAAGGQIVP